MTHDIHSSFVICHSNVISFLALFTGNFFFKFSFSVLVFLFIIFWSGPAFFDSSYSTTMILFSVIFFSGKHRTEWSENIFRSKKKPEWIRPLNLYLGFVGRKFDSVVQRKFWLGCKNGNTKFFHTKFNFQLLFIHSNWLIDFFKWYNANIISFVGWMIIHWL